MDSRNFVNSECYAKLLREKSKRETTKVSKVQTRIYQEQQRMQHLRPLCPKKPKKLAEKWLKEHPQKPEETNGTRKRPPLSPVVEKKKLSNMSSKNNDNDLLSEIDNSLPGSAKGFLHKKGN